MNNKYSVACITLFRDKYKINTDGICVVYTVDSIRKFDSKSNRTADSIRTQKKTIRRSLVDLCSVLIFDYCNLQFTDTLHAHFIPPTTSLISSLFLTNQLHESGDSCLEDESEDYQSCSVLGRRL